MSKEANSVEHALKLALEASKDLCTEFALAKVREILEDALAKQSDSEQLGEPVVVMTREASLCSPKFAEQLKSGDVFKLYTTPQPAERKRTWVGLTDDEINEFRSGYQSGRIGSFVELFKAIEAKLKEKNT